MRIGIFILPLFLIGCVSSERSGIGKMESEITSYDNSNSFNERKLSVEDYRIYWMKILFKY